MARHLHPRLLCLAAVVLAAAAPAYAIFHFDFRTNMFSPFGSYPSREDSWRRGALESTARAEQHAAALGKALGKKKEAEKEKEVDISEAEGTPKGNQGHWMTVGIGTPPQPAKLVLDTGSPLIWTQCMLFDGPKAKQVEPIVNPAKSSTFEVIPCSDELCQGADFTNCTNSKCMYTTQYVGLSSDGVFAYDTFTFGNLGNVAAPLGFGCGTLSGAEGGLDGASGIMGLSWSNLSLISQLSVPRFSYCLAPLTDKKKTSPLLFGTKADLRKFKTAGPVQTVNLIKNPVSDANYYLPLVAISLGGKRLEVPAKSLALDSDGSGGTIIVSASTLGFLVKPAFEALKKELLAAVKLPLARAPKEYQLCFALPAGTPMSKVEVPPLRLHFEGGAEMVLPRDNYFQEPTPGVMCLAIAESPESFSPNIISSVQQQNIFVLFDIRNSKLSFAPAECGDL